MNPRSEQKARDWDINIALLDLNPANGMRRVRRVALHLARSSLLKIEDQLGKLLLADGSRGRGSYECIYI